MIHFIKLAAPLSSYRRDPFLDILNPHHWTRAITLPRRHFLWYKEAFIFMLRGMQCHCLKLSSTGYTNY
jgi:hypothetical protein